MVDYSRILVIGETKEHIGLQVKGHAVEYGGHGDGKNIVCAAVSTVCDMAIRGCLAYDANADYEVNDGYTRLLCERTPETDAILQAAHLEMDEIKAHYPMCFTKEGE